MSSDHLRRSTTSSDNRWGQEQGTVGPQRIRVWLQVGSESARGTCLHWGVDDGNERREVAAAAARRRPLILSWRYRRPRRRRPRRRGRGRGRVGVGMAPGTRRTKTERTMSVRHRHDHNRDGSTADYIPTVTNTCATDASAAQVTGSAR